MKYFVTLLSLSLLSVKAETNVLYAHFASVTERAKTAYTFQLEGKNYVTPGGGYVQSYVRDAAMLATSGFMTAQEIQDHLELYLLVQQPSGAIPDGLYLDSIDPPTPIGQENPVVCLDNAFYMIRLCYEHFLLTGSNPSLWTNNQVALSNAIAYVPVSNALVWCSTNEWVKGWGFHDGIKISGHDLMCSLLRFQAMKELAEMSTAAGQTAFASSCLASVTSISNSLRTNLWDNSKGLFRSSTGTCSTNHDVICSSYAVVIGAVDNATALSISNSLVSQTNILSNGAIRHLADGQEWELTDSVAVGTYQNGGYWPAFTPWRCKAIGGNIMAVKELAVEAAIEDLTIGSATEGAALYEWFHDSVGAGEAYLISSAIPAAFAKTKTVNR